MTRIAIIGLGRVGTAIGRRLVAAGHYVAVGSAPGDDELVNAARAIGPDIATGVASEMVRASDIILLSTPWATTLEVARAIAPAAGGKIVWDATNPLKPDLTGLVIGTTTSGGEEVARALPGACVVKAIPPMAALMAEPGALDIDGRRPSVFVCGDDADARAQVAALVDAIGADAVDSGPLALARYTEPFGMLQVHLATSAGIGARIGGALLRETM